jgi:hypothetical protein
VRVEAGIERVDRSRITFLAGALAAAFTLARWHPAGAAASALPEATVYKSPT